MHDNTYQPKHRARAVDDAARDFLSEMFKPKGPWSDYGYCFSVEDGMDGYNVHTKECGRASWSGGTGCDNPPPFGYVREK